MREEKTGEIFGALANFREKILHLYRQKRDSEELKRMEQSWYNYPAK